jgi:mannose-6-phosphate isomerase
VTTPPQLLPPFALQPQFVARVWGTRDLRAWYPDLLVGEPIGEAWLSGDDCQALSGPLVGQPLRRIFAENAASISGSHTTDSPLLIKILFAQEKLSVQVHPDDAMAQRKGFPRGKTECWYALEAQPGAQVACGLKSGASLAAIEASLHDHTLENWLNVLPVSTGEMIFVDAGTVHAIWPGSVLLETQQNCDLTYRLYDYGRPRELHIQESLEALRLHTQAGKVAPIVQPDRTLLLDSSYFRIERQTLHGSLHSAQLRSSSEPPALSYLFAGANPVSVHTADPQTIPWPANSLLAIPAACKEFQLRSTEPVDLIRIVARQPIAS